MAAPTPPFVQLPPTSVVPAKKLSGKTVTMVFSRPVTLTLQDNSQVKFPMGIQEVAVEYADHKYLELCGVQKYTAEQAKAHPILVTLTPAVLEYLQANGEELQTLEDAQSFLQNLQPSAPKSNGPDLGSMKKEELLAHAKDTHGLELDPSMKKSDIVAAITEAAAAKKT